MTKSGKRPGQRGFGNIRALLGLAVIVLMIYLAAKLMPPYINNYELGSAVEGIARYGAYAQNKSADDIRADVIAKAKECDVILTAENVTVDKTQYAVNLDVKYSVTVEVFGRPVTMSFNPTAGNKMIAAK